jgi:hypothetical protein
MGYGKGLHSNQHKQAPEGVADTGDTIISDAGLRPDAYEKGLFDEMLFRFEGRRKFSSFRCVAFVGFYVIKSYP